MFHCFLFIMLLVFNRTRDFANIHTFSESTKEFRIIFDTTKKNGIFLWIATISKRVPIAPIIYLNRETNKKRKSVWTSFITYLMRLIKALGFILVSQACIFDKLSEHQFGFILPFYLSHGNSS